MRRCDSRCHTARLDRCQCICYGLNHGCQRGPITTEDAIKEAGRALLKRRIKPPRWSRIKLKGRQDLKRQFQLELPFDVDKEGQGPETEGPDLVIIDDDRESGQQSLRETLVMEYDDKNLERR